MNSEEAAACARVMKALANPVRLMIVERLSMGEMCVCELLPLFKLNQSTLSRHLACLKNAGIVRERRDGVRIFHSLACPCVLIVFECTRRVLGTEARRKTRCVPGKRSQ